MEKYRVIMYHDIFMGHHYNSIRGWKLPNEMNTQWYVCLEINYSNMIMSNRTL